MKRRNFLKSALAAIAAVPLMSFVGKAVERERIYLRRGEVLQGRTFTKDVEVWMEEETVIRNCYFDKASLHVVYWRGGDPRKRLLADSTFIGSYVRC